MDNRVEKLASNVVNYSCNIKENEKVYISAIGFGAKPLLKALIREIYKVGAYPYTDVTDEAIIKEIVLGCSEEQLKFFYEKKYELISSMDVYIDLGAINNQFDLIDVPLDKMGIFLKAQSKINKIKFDKKYTVLKFITPGLAQKASMGIDNFEDFYYKVCNLDYDNMSKAMDKLVNLMEKTDKVRIKNSTTDLEFSIKGMSVVKCDGKVNIPDGEVFTAPVKETVNGYIKFNTKSSYRGYTFTDIYFEIKDGKIIKASADDTEKINKLLDTDEGARYFGEFAFGLNPFITKIMGDILYDEKIAGSIHLTPGAAYSIADNGNESYIHWDIVLMLKKENGGGEIFFDDVLIQKDGIFILPELKSLNFKA